MKKKAIYRIVLCSVVLGAGMPAMAQEPEAEPVILAAPMPSAQHINRLSIGVRGGVTSFLQDAGDAKNQLGFDALLDLQYAFYGITNGQHKVGFLVGASAGYTRAGMTLGATCDKFTAATTDGEIQYTVSADNMAEIDGLVTVEVPVMFSLVTRGGFFMNVGPRVQIPVYSHYDLHMENPNIDAYFTKEKVQVHNALITGRVENNDVKGQFAIQKYNLLVGLELGYEWQLKSGDALSLGAFGNYGVYTFYQSGAAGSSVITVTPPSATYQPAKVEISSLRDVYGKGSAFLDCGLKLTYHFLVGKAAL